MVNFNVVGGHHPAVVELHTASELERVLRATVRYCGGLGEERCGAVRPSRLTVINVSKTESSPFHSLMLPPLRGVEPERDR